MDVMLLLKILVFVGVFGFMVWQMVHTRNWGKFDRASMLVWGSVLFVVALVIVGIAVMLHQAGNQ